MTKKLHELIKMAKEGKKFKAFYDEAIYDEKHFASIITWHWNSVIADWEYQEIREPEVVEFECEFWEENQLGYIIPAGLDIADKLTPLIGRKWKVVCTEVIDE